MTYVLSSPSPPPGKSFLKIALLSVIMTLLLEHLVRTRGTPRPLFRLWHTSITTLQKTSSIGNRIILSSSATPIHSRRAPKTVVVFPFTPSRTPILEVAVPRVKITRRYAAPLEPHPQ